MEKRGRRKGIDFPISFLNLFVFQSQSEDNESNRNWEEAEGDKSMLITIKSYSASKNQEKLKGRVYRS